MSAEFVPMYTIVVIKKYLRSPHKTSIRVKELIWSIAQHKLRHVNTAYVKHPMTVLGTWKVNKTLGLMMLYINVPMKYEEYREICRRIREVLSKQFEKVEILSASRVR